MRSTLGMYPKSERKPFGLYLHANQVNDSLFAFGRTYIWRRVAFNSLFVFQFMIKVLVLSNCVIIVWIHIGNRMVNYHIWWTFNFSVKHPSIRFTSIQTINWMKATHQAEYQSDPVHTSMIYRKLKLSIWLNQQVRNEYKSIDKLSN